MLITSRQGHEIPWSETTPQTLLRARPRRRALLASGAGLLTALASGARADAPVDPRYPPGRKLTAKADATDYNNFYEFGDDKDIAGLAQALRTTPWTVEIGGMVHAGRTIALDDLIRTMPIEQRVLRHRCVEGWAMTVPWTGFPLAHLLALVEPLGAAKYVAFTSASQPDVMPGLGTPYYPWPYTEGLALDEANHDLAFMATGMYGGPLAKQDGAPIRLLVPWKYGFKSAKSITRITLTDQRPTTFWEALGPGEYGFWANVNPAIAHPRWSQATERLLGSGEIVPTQIYNGYGASVASLYAGRQGETLFR